MSSAVNVLTNSLNILHSTKRDFFKFNYLHSDQEISKRCSHPDCKSVWARLPCCLSKGPLKPNVLDIYLTRFMESVILEIHQLWGSSFSWKSIKFNIYFKNADKNWEKVFCFCHKCISIGSAKLSLLRRVYLCSPVNVLTNSLKIFDSTKRDFFQLNYLHSHQWIW